MKPLVAPLLSLLILAPVAAEPLSEADRQVLLSRLDRLRNQAGEYVSKRLGGAARDFSAAMKSDSAAVDLYVQCVEKVNFEDRERDASEFREWKRENRDRLREDAFARVLRHQLRWAVLTIQAANQPEDLDELAPQAMQALAAIFEEPAAIREHVQVLSQPVTSSVFGQAYGLNGYETEGWPLAPLRGKGGCAPVFTSLVFPALRAERDIPGLRRAWERFIRYEEMARGYWSEDSTDEGESLELDTFIAERRPELRWQMEEDLFQLGDQKNAALGMLELLAENLSSSQAREWEARFRQLIDPLAPAAQPAEEPQNSLDIDS